MYAHRDLTDAQLFPILRSGAVTLAGNRRLRIYGRLDCWSGRRMSRANRVFFTDQTEARAAGYRPCAHCLPEEYRRWRAGQFPG